MEKFRAFFQSFSSTGRVLRTLLNSLFIFLTIISTVWFGLYVLHLLIPTQLVSTYYSENVGSFKSALFRPMDDMFGENDPYGDSELGIIVESGTTQWWLRICYPARPTKVDETTENLRLNRLLASVSSKSFEIDRRSVQGQADLVSLRMASLWFSSVLIVLGMATTIVSALNSTEFGSGSSYSASMIKVTAIILPALATAVTAYSALYASSDQAARKTQLVYNLSLIHI